MSVGPQRAPIFARTGWPLGVRAVLHSVGERMDDKTSATVARFRTLRNARIQTNLHRNTAYFVASLAFIFGRNLYGFWRNEFKLTCFRISESFDLVLFWIGNGCLAVAPEHLQV